MEAIDPHVQRKVWFENVFGQKMAQNPHYTLRSFAKRLGVSPSTLSRILSGERALTFKMALRVANFLELSANERQGLLSLYIEEKENEGQSYELNEDTFLAIKEWYHYGILQLIRLENFKSSATWIAKSLGISILEAKLAIERLVRLNMITRDQDGTLVRTSESFKTKSDYASAGLRDFQRQILQKAIDSLEKDDLSERDITSITVATNEANLKYVKEEIQKFRYRLAEILESGPKTRVYNLGIHLIPLSEKRKNYEN